MVFPASPTPDAHATTALITRLELILRLGDAGVLVLIDQGKPAQFGTFVRTVLQLDERLEVLTTALGFTRVEAGSCIVLVPDPGESAWMNQERPILAQRRLRVLLYCDKPETVEIARGAPDFSHWISHWMEAPRGGWPPALHGLRAAANREIPIAWEGDDFEAAFAAAFGEVKRVTMSASMPYPELVQALQQQPEWIVLTDVDGPFRRRRVYWAMAESGRKGKLVVLQPKGQIDGFARVTSTPMRLKDAENQLTRAGATRAAKLAAILDCEAEAVEIAARLLSNGVGEDDCIAVWRNEDPGVALVKLAETRGVEVPKDAPCVMREKGTGAGFVIKDLFTITREAIASGDIEVGERFLVQAISQNPNDADALTLRAGVLSMHGRAYEAIRMLETALSLLNKPDLGDAQRRIAIRLPLAIGDLNHAEQHIIEACQIMEQNPSHVASLEYARAINDLAKVLVARRKFEEARDKLEQATQLVQIATAPEDVRDTDLAEFSLTYAHVLAELGEYEQGRALLEKTHRTLLEKFGPKHKLTQDAAHLLSRIPPISQ